MSDYNRYHERILLQYMFKSSGYGFGDSLKDSDLEIISGLAEKVRQGLKETKLKHSGVVVSVDIKPDIHLSYFEVLLKQGHEPVLSDRATAKVLNSARDSFIKVAGKPTGVYYNDEF